MYLKGDHITNQDHYELLCHQIVQKAEGFDEESLEKTLAYLRDAVTWSDAPNVVACLYEFTKSTLGMAPFWRDHPEWRLAPHELKPFVSFDEQSYKQVVAKQIAADKKKSARKAKASLA